MGEGGQKAQTPSYKKSKSWDVMYNMMTVVHPSICIFESCPVDPKSFHHLKKKKLEPWNSYHGAVVNESD